MKTIFVIGAGANVEIGMPSGDELKEKIAKKLDFKISGLNMTDGDTDLYSALYSVLEDDDRIYEAARILREGLPFAISIDNFLDGHRNDSDVVLVGKLAIVKSILEAEEKCVIHDFLYDNDNDKIQKTWYPSFLKKITEGCDLKEFRERLNNIAFIIFNYDRCFECYMVRALKIYYHIDQNQAIDIVGDMKIIHPYGIISSKIKFGEKITSRKLVQYAQNIRTFTEHSEETRKNQAFIKHHIDRAGQVVFLGFAYHRLNLDLLLKHPGYVVTLADTAPLTNEVDCYGTGYGISKGDRKYIQDTLKKIDTRIINCDISRNKCARFFKKFWYRIYFQAKTDPE